jgi:hypothetical protein
VFMARCSRQRGELSLARGVDDPLGHRLDTRAVKQPNGPLCVFTMHALDDLGSDESTVNAFLA